MPIFSPHLLQTAIATHNLHLLHRRLGIMTLAGSHFITRACSATELSMKRYRIGPASLLDLAGMLGIVARLRWPEHCASEP